ncbi:hypothetical protein PHET_10997 [Paragonimus heterotremus]|uniref:Uncharacterized protein n=1 Tax=Paragonimus heterotremus TaxID=100268 RepID=A0A8J4WTH0_9TREM|nr:hypothetical protein PHET_10997 [Paragonimus heterotremus]
MSLQLSDVLLGPQPKRPCSGPGLFVWCTRKGANRSRLPRIARSVESSAVELFSRPDRLTRLSEHGA